MATILENKKVVDLPGVKPRPCKFSAYCVVVRGSRRNQFLKTKMLQRTLLKLLKKYGNITNQIIIR